MGNLTLVSRTNLSGQECHDGHGLAIQRRKFNLVAFAAPMNEHDGADIATPQVVLGKVALQNHVL